jgi:predicted  nucleic acid-binding Zn-ribbon protein
MSKALRALQRKLERMELEHLRRHALELHNRVEELETHLADANEAAARWQDDAQTMQDALYDKEFSTHRFVGINKAGEMMVVAQ